MECLGPLKICHSGSFVCRRKLQNLRQGSSLHLDAPGDCDFGPQILRNVPTASEERAEAVERDLRAQLTALGGRVSVSFEIR